MDKREEKEEIAVDEKVFSAYLDRLEENQDGTEDAVLLIDDEENFVEFVIPSKFLPEDVSDGDYLTIKISYDDVKTNAALEEARNLLRG